MFATFCAKRFLKQSLSRLSSSRRLYSKAASCFSVVYKEHGDPVKVLSANTETMRSLDELGSDELAIRMVAAPINPADINTIQGVYPVKPTFPAVGGNEGVGEVSAIGANVTNFAVGDWVVPLSGWGTWRTHGTCQAHNAIKIANDISAVSAATMAVNPCTAYRMLVDFERLEPGDIVIQNGANSGVGQAVIQIAAEMELQTINIIRNRPDVDSLVQTMKDLGATYVVTDEFIRTPQMKDLMKLFPKKPKLALNCVSGKAAAGLLKYLDHSGTMVTYGGMSKQPLMVPAGPLIFNDVKLRGYWMTRWNSQHGGCAEKQRMWNFLCDMARKNNLKPPKHRQVYIEDFQQAVAKAMEPFVGEKQILVMDKTLDSISTL